MILRVEPRAVSSCLIVSMLSSDSLTGRFCQVRLVPRPLFDDFLERCLPVLEIVCTGKRNKGAVFCEPGQQVRWIINRPAQLALRPDLCAVVQNELHSGLCSNVDRRKPAVAIKARGIPLDPLRNVSIRLQDRSPDGLDHWTSLDVQVRSDMQSPIQYHHARYGLKDAPWSLRSFA